MDQERQKFLEEKAKEIRKLIVKTIGAAGQGHIGGSMSIVEVVTVLYFDVMNIDPKNPKMKGRDQLVLSKGHAGPGLYSALALKGFFPIDWLMTLNKPNTNLPSHCDMNRTPGMDMTTGSLGQGLSCAVGLAAAAKIKKSTEYIYAIIGDGESQEGLIWEASMSAAQFKLDHLIVFLDNNNWQIDGTVDEVMSLIDPVEKWKSFGFNTLRVDGHDVKAIAQAISQAKEINNGKPAMIVLDTVKGQGLSYLTREGFWNHAIPLSPAQVEEFIAELDGEVK